MAVVERLAPPERAIAIVGWCGPDRAPVFAAGTIQGALDNFGHEEIGWFADQGPQIRTMNVLEAMINAQE